MMHAGIQNMREVSSFAMHSSCCLIIGTNINNDVQSVCDERLLPTVTSYRSEREVSLLCFVEG